MSCWTIQLLPYRLVLELALRRNNRINDRKANDALKAQRHISIQLGQALLNLKSEIPVIAVVYNNGIYAEHLTRQLCDFGIRPIIIDNASTDSETLHIMDKLEKEKLCMIVRSPMNFGHMVGFLPLVYSALPQCFAYTDPDILFSPNLPSNFLITLRDLAFKYQTFKAGFALDLCYASEVTGQTVGRQTVDKTDEKYWGIREWESQFWRFRLDDTLEVYAADIDTTFAVYVKDHYKGDFYDAIRVAGKYKSIHMPWFPSMDIMSAPQREIYLSNNISTTWMCADKPTRD